MKKLPRKSKPLPRSPLQKSIGGTVGFSIAVLFGVYFVMFQNMHSIGAALAGPAGLYLLVFWFILLPIKTKRFKRAEMASGRCPGCRYDMRGHDGDDVVCPECGQNVRQSH